jgi:hypothetical protein
MREQNKFLSNLFIATAPALHLPHSTSRLSPSLLACLRQRISQRDRAPQLTSPAPQSTASAGLCRRSRGAPPHLILSQLSRDSCICEERGRFRVVRFGCLAESRRSELHFVWDRGMQCSFPSTVQDVREIAVICSDARTMLEILFGLITFVIWLRRPLHFLSDWRGVFLGITLIRARRY